MEFFCCYSLIPQHLMFLLINQYVFIFIFTIRGVDLDSVAEDFFSFYSCKLLLASKGNFLFFFLLNIIN